MQPFKVLFFIPAMVLTAPAYADTVMSSCPGFAQGSSELDVDKFYVQRAVSIVGFGLQNNIEALQIWVAPTATYEIRDGDQVLVSRQRGITAAIEMAKAMNASRFQSAATIPSSGSISPIKCTWSTTVLFRADQSQKGTLMKLEFVDGRLVRAVGKTVSIAEGNVR